MEVRSIAYQIKSQRDNFTGEASVSISKDRSFKKITSKDDYLSLTFVKTLFIYHSDAYVSFRSNNYSKSFSPRYVLSFLVEVKHTHAHMHACACARTHTHTLTHTPNNKSTDEAVVDDVLFH